MARIRTIKPVFFRHNEMYLAEKESKLPLRLAFIGLWTVADREGRFRWKPIEIKLDIFPYDNLDFESILEALLKYGFIVKYVVNKEVLGFIPSFLKHQIPNSHEAKSTLDAYSETDNAYASTCMHVNASLEGKGSGREVEGKGTDKTLSQSDTHSDHKPIIDSFHQAYLAAKGSKPDIRAVDAKAVKGYLKRGFGLKDFQPLIENFLATDPKFAGGHYLKYLCDNPQKFKESEDARRLSPKTGGRTQAQVGRGAWDEPGI